MSLTDAAPSEGALSIDQAAGLLAAEPPEEQEAAPVEEAAPAVEETAEEPAAPAVEDTEAEATEEAPLEVEEPAEAQAGPHAPPMFWKAEDKAWFAEQPKEVQERLLSHDQAREQTLRQSMREMAEARNAAQAEAANIQALSRQATHILEQAKATFARPIPELGVTWDQIDWKGWLAQDPATALAYKARYDMERDELNQLEATAKQANEVTQTKAFEAYAQAEYGKLHELAPELARDGAKRTEIGNYLVTQGYSPDALKGIGALDMVIARKAMLYDQALAAQKAPKPPTTQAKAPAAKTLRPGAAAPVVAPQKRAVQEANNRFAQTRTKEDAIAALNARSGA